MQTKKLKLLTTLLFLLPLCVALLGAGCDDDESEELLHDITLSDKPLSVIQQYITGDWKLQYSIGGIAGSKYIDESNSYMILSPNHITKGDDSKGVFVDEDIDWIKTEIGTNEFTYLMSYPPSPISYIVIGIKTDTLVIRDYLSDGFTYYYTKD